MEVVGLVLAVVPMVSAAAQHWTVVYRVGKTVVSQKTKDEAAVEDYRRIFWNLVLLDVHLRDLVAALPDLTDDEKAKLLEAELQVQTPVWTNPRVESALNRHLGTVDRREAIMNCLQTICMVLEVIVSDRTLGLQRADLVVSIIESPLPSGLAGINRDRLKTAANNQSRPIYTKLETIRRNSGQNSETFVKRLHFTSNTKNRHRARKQLDEYVAVFERLVTDKGTRKEVVEESEATLTTLPVEISPPPDSRHRTLIHRVYNAMESRWDCDCAPRHRAKMCLKRRFDTFDDESIASLDILISVKDNSTAGWWHEGCVVLDPAP